MLGGTGFTAGFAEEGVVTSDEALRVPLEDLPGMTPARRELLGAPRTVHRGRSALSFPALLRGPDRPSLHSLSARRRCPDGARRGRRARTRARSSDGKFLVSVVLSDDGTQRARRGVVQPGAGGGKVPLRTAVVVQRQAEVVSRSLADDQSARADPRRRRWPASPGIVPVYPLTEDLRAEHAARPHWPGPGPVRRPAHRGAARGAAQNATTGRDVAAGAAGRPLSRHAGAPPSAADSDSSTRNCCSCNWRWRCAAGRCATGSEPPSSTQRRRSTPAFAGCSPSPLTGRPGPGRRRRQPRPGQRAADAAAGAGRRRRGQDRRRRLRPAGGRGQQAPGGPDGPDRSAGPPARPHAGPLPGRTAGCAGCC